MHAERSILIQTPLVLMVAALLAATSLSGCLENFGQTSPVLYWGNVPDEERMKELKEMGIKTIINVRTNPLEDRAAAARKLGLNFFHIRTGVIRTPKKEQIEEFLRIARDPQYQPVYLGCVGGRDRTAFYLATYAMAEKNVSAEEAAEDMNKHGLRPYWVTFRLYKRRLIQREDEIRQFAQQQHRITQSTPQLPTP